MWRPLNNTKMRKLIISCIFLLLSGISGLASTRNLEVERVASELLFYLASDEQILTIQQVENFIARKDTSVSRLYVRLEEARKKNQKESSALLKTPEESTSQVIYKAQDIRRAALEEILSLGDGVVPVLIEAVNSARQDVVLGVIRGLRELKSKKSLAFLVDVLERSPSGYTRFSDRARREAITSLGEITERDERWRKLMQDAMADIDAKLRQMSRMVVSQEMSDWSTAQLLNSWKLELKLYKAQRAAAQQRDLLQIFDENGVESVWVMKALECLFQAHLTPEPSLPEELIGRQDFLRLMLQHLAVLPTDSRSKVLNLALADHQQGVIKLEAIQALGVQDKVQYAPDILRLLRVQEDPEVLAAVLQCFDRWQLTGSRDKIEALVLQSRHEKVKVLAQKILDQTL
jgi:hypothetical protein